jgi:hypothetical protein
MPWIHILGLVENTIIGQHWFKVKVSLDDKFGSTINNVYSSSCVTLWKKS